MTAAAHAACRLSWPGGGATTLAPICAAHAASWSKRRAGDGLCHQQRHPAHRQSPATAAQSVCTTPGASAGCYSGRIEALRVPGKRRGVIVAAVVSLEFSEAFILGIAVDAIDAGRVVKFCAVVAEQRVVVNVKLFHFISPAAYSPAVGVIGYPMIKSIHGFRATARTIFNYFQGAWNVDNWVN